jgi:hypothetical protein
MKRRTLFQSVAAVLLARPFARWPLAAPAQAALSSSDVATLHAIGDVVLPDAAGADGKGLVVDRFVAWVRNYREGADMGHGYGASTLRRPSGPSPALRYPPQFAALDRAAAALGAKTFAALSREQRVLIVEARLNEPERVTRLPAQPTGANLIADLMGFYFNSPDARDLCYQRDIGADRCRSLDGSEQEPERLRGR